MSPAPGPLPYRLDSGRGRRHRLVDEHGYTGPRVRTRVDRYQHGAAPSRGARFAYTDISRYAGNTSPPGRTRPGLFRTTRSCLMEPRTWIDVATLDIGTRSGRFRPGVRGLAARSGRPGRYDQPAYEVLAYGPPTFHLGEDCRRRTSPYHSPRRPRLPRPQEVPRPR